MMHMISILQEITEHIQEKKEADLENERLVQIYSKSFWSHLWIFLLSGVKFNL